MSSFCGSTWPHFFYFNFSISVIFRPIFTIFTQYGLTLGKNKNFQVVFFGLTRSTGNRFFLVLPHEDLCTYLFLKNLPAYLADLAGGRGMIWGSSAAVKGPKTTRFAGGGAVGSIVMGSVLSRWGLTFWRTMLSTSINFIPDQDH